MTSVPRCSFKIKVCRLAWSYNTPNHKKREFRLKCQLPVSCSLSLGAHQKDAGMHVSAQFVDFMFVSSSSVNRAAPEHYYIISSVFWCCLSVLLLSVNLSYSWRCCSIYEIKTFLRNRSVASTHLKAVVGSWTLTKGKWSSLPLITLHGVNEGGTTQLRLYVQHIAERNEHRLHPHERPWTCWDTVHFYCFHQ